jgi:hypothetical protein
MGNQILRDSTGRTLGKITQANDGRLTLTDSTGRILGYYDPRANRTTKSDGSSVGSGNLLTTLLR